MLLGQPDFLKLMHFEPHKSKDETGSHWKDNGDNGFALTWWFIIAYRLVHRGSTKA